MQSDATGCKYWHSTIIGARFGSLGENQGWLRTDDDAREVEGVFICRGNSNRGGRNGKSAVPLHRSRAHGQEQVVERHSGQMGNAREGKGYIHATHQNMSRFGSRRETGYQRVADVIQDFVAEATQAVEGKRLPRAIPTTG